MITSAWRLQSQYYFYNDKYYNSVLLVESGVTLGGMNCLTDLGGKEGRGKPFLKDINWEKTHLTSGIYINLMYDQALGLRVEANFGKVSAADQVLNKDHSVSRHRYYRNLHFRSRILEGCFVAEVLPLAILNKEKYTLLSPYLLAGIGFFKFSPQAFIGNQWVDLQPLSTEGQGFKEYPGRESYRLIQVNFPLGMGLRYELSALITIRIDIVYRFLRTDYLDDVSTRYVDPGTFYSNHRTHVAVIAEQLADRGAELTPGFYKKEGEIRGNPANRDGYFSGNLKFGLFLNRRHR
jgi:hypothetical protein